ncbi:MAG: alpha-mannosidase [Phycisphaerales bacterium]|nr:alpha-mannosidase [Phycisphaerales bacterium]MCB9855768.1 alpha-mannosidase [Phycisphaerales bacterium]MCB9862663.1 alpha-mannosidase [Phycisphaerales bacterium]
MFARSLVVVIVAAAACAPAHAADDTCILFTAENLAKGPGNWYLYVQFSTARYTIQDGDTLEYDIYMPGTNPVLKGGMDIQVEGANLPPELKDIHALRESRLKDQEGLRLHGDAILEPAHDKWYRRKFKLDGLVGATTTRWELVFEGDEDGKYVQFIDNIRIKHKGKTALKVYRDGPIENDIKGQGNNGYSAKFNVVTTMRSEVGDPKFMTRIFETAEQRRRMRESRDAFHAELDMADLLAKEKNDAHMLSHINEARRIEDTKAYDRGDAEAYLKSLHQARGKLKHEHQVMERYTGHLVGHAHIDLAWLWTWDDSINNVIPHTFGQALVFMDEFAEFTFSQSSATLYQATQVHHPKLFEKIRERVREGRWEIVGGRWCEGDNNMISPESHARHFLYGQRYFKKHFDRMARVGWEPDTFGHCWTMPQILRKSGIDSYYFCRGGKNEPLFWWEGPDGSRVLAFEEPATGGWYNDDVSDEKVKELIRFALKTGTTDELMVYGVGNHGGGPTREYIESALAMKDREGWPLVKFSTATEFFDILHKMSDKLTIPTIKTDLNPVFSGCYTSQSEIKRLNRKSECAIESAEVLTTLAHMHDNDLAYPRAKFEALWQDVLWSHHHDTLPGSCIHAAALYARELLADVVADAESLRSNAMNCLAAPFPGGIVVFNPTSGVRSDVVDIAAPVTRVGSAGDMMPVQRTENGACFVARDIPAMGYRVFTPEFATDDSADDVLPYDIANIPGSTGTSEPQGAAATAHANRIAPVFQMLHEKPGGGTAWTIQGVDKTESLEKPVFTQVLEDGDVRCRVRRIYRWNNTTITSDEIRYAHTPRIDYDVTVDWMEIGDNQEGSQMLKVAIPTRLANGTATAEIPFGDIERDKDGKEYPMLKWVDVSSAERGVTVLNDCKYGYDVQSDGTIRVTLMRAPYNPDPVADVGVHRMRFAILPHDGPLDKAAAVHAGDAFNKPLLGCWNASQGDVNVTWATQPLRNSLCSVDAQNIVITAIKQAEDGKAVIIRAYECAGRRTKANFDLSFECSAVREVNLVEYDMPTAGAIEQEQESFSTTFSPYEIRTFLLTTD